MEINRDELAGKVAIVTGGGTGIGAATVRRLASAGAAVVVGGRRLDVLDAIVEEIGAEGTKGLAVQTDMLVEDDIRRLVDTTMAEFGRIDIVINNAGADPYYPNPLENTPTDRWDDVISLNLRGPFLLTQFAGRHMLDQGSGTFVNISSQAGLSGVQGGAAYSCGKAGLQMLTKMTAKEWGARGIRANCIAVGAIATYGLHEALRSAGALDTGIYENAQPPDTIAQWVMHFVTDTIRFSNGETIVHTG